MPTGAMMLVSDLPLKKGGIKSKDNAEEIFLTYTQEHLQMGLKVMKTACLDKRTPLG